MNSIQPHVVVRFSSYVSKSKPVKYFSDMESARVPERKIYAWKLQKNPKNGSVLRGKNIFGRSFLPDKNRPSETPKRMAFRDTQVFEHVNLRTGKFEDEPGNFFADQEFFPGSSSNFPVRKFTSASFFFEVGFARWQAKPASWNRSHLRPLLSAVHARPFSRSAVGG